MAGTPKDQLVDPRSETKDTDGEEVDIPSDVSESSSEYSQMMSDIKCRPGRPFYAVSPDPSDSSTPSDLGTPVVTTHDSEDDHDDWEDVTMEDVDDSSRIRLDGTMDGKDRTTTQDATTKETRKNSAVEEEEDRLKYYDAEDFPAANNRNRTLDYVRKSFRGFVQGRTSNERSGHGSSSSEMGGTPQEQKPQDEDEARKAKDIKGAPLLFRLDNPPQTSTERQIAYERLAILLRQRWASSRDFKSPPTTVDLVRQLAAEVHDDCMRFVPDFRPAPLWPHEAIGESEAGRDAVPVPWRRRVVMLFENEWMGWFVREAERGEGVSVGIGMEGKNIFPSEYPKWERRYGKASGH